MATHEFDGKPWSMGTKNWRQPDQCPISSIMQIRLKIRMNTLAMLRNCKIESSMSDMIRQERPLNRKWRFHEVMQTTLRIAVPQTNWRQTIAIIVSREAAVLVYLPWAYCFINIWMLAMVIVLLAKNVMHKLTKPPEVYDSSQSLFVRATVLVAKCKQWVLKRQESVPL